LAGGIGVLIPTISGFGAIVLLGACLLNPRRDGI
jgi:hypothetical protein